MNALFQVMAISSLVLQASCGVKSPPLPPLTDEEETAIQLKQKTRADKEARREARLQEQKRREAEQERIRQRNGE
jgi:hypothetical protein